MKVLALILMAIALAAGKGSGPYIYERPDGRAFFLPSEIVDSLTPVVDVNLQGSESSGSDFLREYGPPIALETSQGLPDVTIEKSFEDVAENVVGITEAKPEAISLAIPTIASQSSVDDNPTISAQLPILDFEVKETTATPNVEQATEAINQSIQLSQESNLESNQESILSVITAQSQQNVDTQTTESATVETNQGSQESLSGRSIQQDSIQSLQYQQESSTLSGSEVTAGGDSISTTEVLLVNAPESVSEQKVTEVQNIPDIIASFEKEILAQQAEGLNDIGSVQSLGQIPEGFLEYGPPGFIEYGPPKEDEEKVAVVPAITSNETRRRRFSPRLVKKTWRRRFAPRIIRFVRN